MDLKGIMLNKWNKSERQTQQLFMMKTLRKMDIQGKYLNITVTYDKPSAHATLSREDCKFFL